MMNNLKINRLVFVMAATTVAFSILFFMPPYKTAEAKNNSIVPKIPTAGQYINGNYVYTTVDYATTTYSSTGYSSNNSSQSYGSVSYGSQSYSSSYSSQSYGSNSYTSPAYTGSTYGSLSYGNVSYGGSSYGGIAYGGSSYGSGSYGSASYSSAGSQAASVAYAKCEPYLKSYLGYGKANNPDEVKKLQEFLNNKEGEKLSVSGVFDLPTLEAVKRFQDKYAKDILQESWGLSCNTGYVYITTLAKINDIVCNTSTDFKNIPLPDPRPVFRCSGEIDPMTKAPEPCTAVIVSSATSTNATTTDSNNDLTAETQTAGVGFLGKLKGLWKDAIT